MRSTHTSTTKSNTSNPHFQNTTPLPYPPSQNCTKFPHNSITHFDNHFDTYAKYPSTNINNKLSDNYKIHLIPQTPQFYVQTTSTNPTNSSRKYPLTKLHFTIIPHHQNASIYRTHPKIIYYKPIKHKNKTRIHQNPSLIGSNITQMLKLKNPSIKDSYIFHTTQTISYSHHN